MFVFVEEFVVCFYLVFVGVCFFVFCVVVKFFYFVELVL